MAEIKDVLLYSDFLLERTAALIVSSYPPAAARRSSGPFLVNKVSIADAATFVDV